MSQPSWGRHYNTSPSPSPWRRYAPPSVHFPHHLSLLISLFPTWLHLHPSHSPFFHIFPFFCPLSVSPQLAPEQFSLFCLTRPKYYVIVRFYASYPTMPDHHHSLFLSLRWTRILSPSYLRTQMRLITHSTSQFSGPLSRRDRAVNRLNRSFSWHISCLILTHLECFLPLNASFPL